MTEKDISHWRGYYEFQVRDELNLAEVGDIIYLQSNQTLRKWLKGKDPKSFRSLEYLGKYHDDLDTHMYLFRPKTNIAK